MNEILKKIAVSFLLISLIIFGGSYYIASRIESVVLSNITEYVNVQSNGLYELVIGKINYRFINRGMEFNNIELIVNQMLLNRLREENKVPEFLLECSLERVSLKGIKLHSFRKNQHLDFSRLSIEKPEVNIMKQVDGRKTNSTRHFNIFEHFSPASRSFFIEELHLQDGVFQYLSIKDNDTSRFGIDQIDVSMSRVRIDNTLPQPFNYDDILLAVQGLSYVTPGHLYEWKIQRADFTAKDSLLNIEHLALLPGYDKLDIVHHELLDDRIEFNVALLTASGFHFDSLVYKRTLLMDSLTVQRPNLNVFKNKNLIHPARYRPMFYSYWQKAPLNIQIGHVRANNGTVEYEELPLGENMPGSLTFNAISLQCDDFKNIADNQEAYINITTNSKLMNTGSLRVNFQLPADSLNNNFAVTGHLGFMPMNILNRILEPLAPARIKTGTINSVDFIIKGSDRISETEMLFQYNDLQIAIFKEKNDRIRKMGFASRLINQFVLKSDNPPSGEEAVPVHIVVHRNTKRSSFNYLWYSLYAGIKTTVGITEAKEDYMRDLQAKIQELKILTSERKNSIN